MFKCMIFDFDGTIADTLPLCIAAFRMTVGVLSGVQPTNQQIIETFGPSEEGTIAALLPDYYEKGITLYLNQYEELHHAMCAAPFHGIVELFHWLRTNGIRLAIVTGKGRKSLEISMGMLGLSHEWFSHIETGSPIGPCKPDGIESVLESLFITPEEAVYIGDSVSDIYSAREARVPVISAAWADTADSDQLRKHKPDYLFQTVESLMVWLNHIQKEESLHGIQTHCI